VIETQIYAAFCGTGKTYLIHNKFSASAIEFECWKYQTPRFPVNYVYDIMCELGVYEMIFISTNPIALKVLKYFGASINLVYPDSSLKSEYMERYRKRKSDENFINILNTYWDIWLTELKQLNYCQHFVLKKEQYLSDIININSNKHEIEKIQNRYKKILR